MSNELPKRDIKLVGKRLPGSDVPRLDLSKYVNTNSVRGGLDLTHIRFHAPFVLPVSDADGNEVAWGVACLGCTIWTNEPQSQCTMYGKDELAYQWPGTPALIEMIGISEVLANPELTIEELEGEGDEPGPGSL